MIEGPYMRQFTATTIGTTAGHVTTGRSAYDATLGYGVALLDGPAAPVWRS